MNSQNNLFNIDKLISENIEKCVGKEIESFDKFNEIEGGVSEEFNQKMIGKIKETTTPNNIKPFTKKDSNKKKITTKYLIAIAAVIMLFTMTVVTPSAFENPIHEFIINTFGKYFTVDTSSEYRIEDVKFEYIEPKWLPEGTYKKEIVKKSEYKYIVSYQYNDFEIIYLQDLISNDEYKINNESNEIKPETFELNGKEYMYVHSLTDEKHSLGIYDDIYYYKLIAPLDCETLTKIAASIF